MYYFALIAVINDIQAVWLYVRKNVLEVSWSVIAGRLDWRGLKKF